MARRPPLASGMAFSYARKVHQPVWSMGLAQWHRRPSAGDGRALGGADGRVPVQRQDIAVPLGLRHRIADLGDIVVVSAIASFQLLRGEIAVVTGQDTELTGPFSASKAVGAVNWARRIPPFRLPPRRG